MKEKQKHTKKNVSYCQSQFSAFNENQENESTKALVHISHIKLRNTILYLVFFGENHSRFLKTLKLKYQKHNLQTPS